ncbi:hybrid sensor histidine kinase/response regulator [Jiella sp. M17.18]|uniref:ATP-binding response regulator n=1 Tax=Jiella sp. M17.18 TaxID=3234247 RepID=UPI0034E02F6E
MNRIVLGTLGAIGETETPDRGPDEVRRLELVNAALMRRIEQVTDSQAQAYSLFQTAIDLESQVRRRTAELSQALARVEQTNRENLTAREVADLANRSKTKFLAAAGHDILQPLNAARLSLSALTASGVSDEGLRYAASIDRSLETMEDLITSVLDIARLDAGALEPEIGEIDLRALIASLVAEFSPVAEGKGLTMRIAGPPLTALSDAALLRRLVANLISNAIRYTRDGGVLIGLRRRGDLVRLDVCDTGIGIAPDQYELIFQEFHRGKVAGEDPRAATGTGLGLGLSIVRRIAEALGHRLSFRSVEGRGTIFSLLLPLVAEPVRIEGARRSEFRPSGFGLALAKVLVIENDQSVMDATLSLLERWSCTVRAASGMRDALPLLSQERFHPDVILADYRLDNGQIGLDVVEAVRAMAGWAVPAIVMTADYSPETRAAVERAGCELLLKPVKPAELRALLAHMAA